MQATSATSVDWLADGLSELLTYLMRSSQRDVLQAFMELDLSLSQMRMILLLESAPRPPALHELAAELGLSVAATGRAADALVRHDLVVREEDPADRRVKRVSLSDQGRDLCVRLRAARRADLRRFAEILTEGERDGLIAALAPILTRPDIRALTIGPHC